ncbi:MFS general substrate transporter [Mycena metata]|uniref:MFS general substrate transporter n=1 Tax=Mycena metata TaxID=1033252 RepID=A0AAD7NY12_9AGAR|nr:MFS general substrate transporter [Mycena metata]
MAWSTIAGAWLIMFATFGWIGSLQSMTPFALGIISGKLFDEGYFHALEIFGGMTFIFSVFMLSPAKPPQYYQGVGMGIGLSFTFVPSISITGLASGIAVSGGAMGSTGFPISKGSLTYIDCVLFFSHLLPKIGFGSAVRATGYIILVFILVGNTLMRTRLLRRSKRPNTSKPDITSFFTHGAYMWTSLGVVLASIGMNFPVIYIQLFATQHSIAIMNGSSACERIIGNYLADVYGPINIQACCNLLTGARIWAVLGIHNTWSLGLVSILYGVFSANPASSARTGVAMAFCSLGFLASSPSQGALLTSSFH